MKPAVGGLLTPEDCQEGFLLEGSHQLLWGQELHLHLALAEEGQEQEGQEQELEELEEGHPGPYWPLFRLTADVESSLSPLHCVREIQCKVSSVK